MSHSRKSKLGIIYWTCTLLSLSIYIGISEGNYKVLGICHDSEKYLGLRERCGIAIGFMKSIEKEPFLNKIEISSKIRYVNSIDLKSVQKKHVPQFSSTNKIFWLEVFLVNIYENPSWHLEAFICKLLLKGKHTSDMVFRMSDKHNFWMLICFVQFRKRLLWQLIDKTFFKNWHGLYNLYA